MQETRKADEFDQEYQKRGVAFVRYADDIVLLAKSERAAKRLLETSTKIRNFKFPGFTLGKNGKGIYVRVHGKSW